MYLPLSFNVLEHTISSYILLRNISSIFISHSSMLFSDLSIIASAIHAIPLLPDDGF